jgi:hypothetical protein
VWLLFSGYNNKEKQRVYRQSFPISHEIDNVDNQCCENDKEHSELVGHHLLDCLLDAMYDLIYLCLINECVSRTFFCHVTLWVHMGP